MLSAEDISAVKVAVQICNSPEIKAEILRASGSDSDLNNGINFVGNERKWDEIVEEKAKVVLDHLGVAKQLQEKVIGIVLLAGLRMLFWAKYHEGAVGISRECSANFLNASFFSQRGIIDNKKAAEELMKDEGLNSKQKYKLACLYCFADHISDLYKQMTKEEKKEFYDCDNSRIKQPELVKFWSYYLMSDVDQLKGEKSLDEYRLEKAVACGSKAAVQYCLERTNLSRKNDAIVDAAMEAVKCKIEAGSFFDGGWVVFGYQDRGKIWVPSDYYVDILSFLLSKMGEVQQIEFFKQDIEGSVQERDIFRDYMHSRVLECFLNWPYQGYFIEKANLMWEFLPERSYAELLFKICNKIDFRKEANLKCSEGRSYNYRALLKEFWCQSPERLKRYVFSIRTVLYCTGNRLNTIQDSAVLLIYILSLSNFANEDRENIELILASASDKEKENMFRSEEWRTFCIGKMKEEEWEMLDRCVLSCFLSKVEEDKFKKELCCSEAAKSVCIGFVAKDKWESAETFMKWSSLPEEEISKLKKEMINSKNGRYACVYLILSAKKLDALDKFITWCFPNQEEAKAFRRVLLFSRQGTGACATLAKRDQLEKASEFINFCLSSEEDDRQFKKMVAYISGNSVCEYLISATAEDLILATAEEDLILATAEEDLISATAEEDLILATAVEDLILAAAEEDIYNNQGCITSTRTIFKGGKWEEVEKFVTWCFSTEEEINDYKKNVLLKKTGKTILFNLVEYNQWEEAETFFAWLGLSAEEIKGLKKETLFIYSATREMFSHLMYSKEGDEEFSDYESEQEAIELLLRWFLTDKETILEFKDDFRSQYRYRNEDAATVWKNFDSKIEQLLRDLEEDQTDVKRKYETSSQSKGFCN